MTGPLTPEEVQSAADKFFPLFEIVAEKMPENSSVQDTLDVMENVCKLAQSLREQEVEGSFPFGFYKKKKDGDS